MNSPIKYKLYATLLDAFQYYLNSEDEPLDSEKISPLQKLINKINRVPFESEAAEKGTAFNNLIDAFIIGKLNIADFNLPEMTYNHVSKSEKEYKFTFKTQVVRDFHNYFKGAIPQVYVEAALETKYGNVLLYGYIDEIKIDKIFDIKTTSNYTFPKFLGNFQHLVYPYCFWEMGNPILNFQYTITDFSNIYKEDYEFRPIRDTGKLVNICERLIDFIEARRDQIIDMKIFALD